MEDEKEIGLPSYFLKMRRLGAMIVNHRRPSGKERRPTPMLLSEGAAKEDLVGPYMP